MHCQHQQKKLTPKQQQKASEAKSKNSRKCLLITWEWKTDCPSKLTVTVLVPSKRDKLASEKKPYLVTRPMVLRVTFNQNHPLAGNTVCTLTMVHHFLHPQLSCLFLAQINSYSSLKWTLRSSMKVFSRQWSELCYYTLALLQLAKQFVTPDEDLPIL